jgi:two-component system, OmpR family, sensor kinase
MSKLPIRIRLTLAFALATAAVLATAGAFLSMRLGSSIDDAIDEALATRLADVSALAAGREGSLADRLETRRADPEERFAQVLVSDGRVIAASPGAGPGAVLRRDDLAALGTGDVLRLERDGVPGIDGRARLLATAVGVGPEKRVAVVGASLDDREEAQDGLVAQLLVIGPAALLLTSLLGYAMATAALRPVDAIRAEAGAISGLEPGRRLSLPSARDEIRRLAETLNEMLERLDRALERERSFVADASHELRTPLAILKAELELALRRPRSSAELERALGSAAAETDRLARLAEDLLALARSDRDSVALRRDSVVARELVGRVAERFARDAGASGRAVEVEVPDGIRLTVDASRLEQALGNLLANALRHGRGSIQLSALERDGHVELHVLDEGSGFPPDFLPHAFDRFTRADEARSGGGAGLGLAIADMVARAHGGSAHAVNRPGGTDVWLSIPKE